MEETGCEIICGAPTTLAVKGLMMMMMMTQKLILAFVMSRLDSPQWGAADAEIKAPSGENTELKRSPFKVWSRSVYSMLSLLPGIFSSLISTLRVHSPAFFPKLLTISPVLAGDYTRTRMVPM